MWKYPRPCFCVHLGSEQVFTDDGSSTKPHSHFQKCLCQYKYTKRINKQKEGESHVVFAAQTSVFVYNYCSFSSLSLMFILVLYYMWPESVVAKLAVCQVKL